MYYGYELELYEIKGHDTTLVEKTYCSHDLKHAIANAESEKARLSGIREKKYLISVRDVYMNQIVYEVMTK
ncbi:MAG: hypothetical protein A3J42_08595 [Candidatus Dadabacteria bacterium RIFCSPHIGHO2_12_FULL_53_21]|nr:MAG: hypothetical protein A3J42_08595 [Candidatus Dadabacteria bacterium RIFCSPHIGHO2_12_FULL_53_21]